MKRILVAVLCFLAAVTLGAQTGSEDGSVSKHQVRIGWGDMLFETMAFHASPTHIYKDPSVLPEDFLINERFDYAYTGHIFAEYQYQCSKVVQVGALLDMEGIFWKEAYYDRYHKVVGDVTSSKNYNLIIMPTVRFNYVRKEYFSIYSGVGAGLLVAFDNARNSALAPALNLNFVGIQAGRGHWYGSAELGMMNALSGGHKIYMLGSRLLSVSVIYRW